MHRTVPRCGACFLCEPAQTIGIGAYECRQNFERDAPAENCVCREVDLAHAAFAEEVDDLVVLYALARGEFVLGSGE